MTKFLSITMNKENRKKLFTSCIIWFYSVLSCLTSYTQHTYKAQAVSTQPRKIRSGLLNYMEGYSLMGSYTYWVSCPINNVILSSVVSSMNHAVIYGFFLDYFRTLLLFKSDPRNSAIREAMKKLLKLEKRLYLPHYWWDKVI